MGFFKDIEEAENFASGVKRTYDMLCKDRDELMRYYNSLDTSSPEFYDLAFKISSELAIINKAIGYLRLDLSDIMEVKQ